MGVYAICAFVSNLPECQSLCSCRPLFEEEVEISDVAALLWNAPFAILAHNNSDDPTFEYGNKAALDLFECDWNELIGTPSRESAAPDKEIQEDRSALLTQALENGYVDDYEGWRRSFKGKPFKVSNATIFSIESPDGAAVGQGAVLRLWEYEDGMQGGPLATPTSVEAECDPEKLRLAQTRVDALAANVRMLKEEKGLTNSNDEVKQAVQELLGAKNDLEQLKNPSLFD